MALCDIKPCDKSSATLALSARVRSFLLIPLMILSSVYTSCNFRKVISKNPDHSIYASREHRNQSQLNAHWLKSLTLGVVNQSGVLFYKLQLNLRWMLHVSLTRIE